MELIELTCSKKQGNRVYHPRGISPCLQSAMGTSGTNNVYVFIQTSGTNTPTQYTGGTMENVTVETLGQSKQKKSQTLTYFAEDFLVKLSALLENGEDLKIPEVLSFLRSHGLSNKNNHAYFSSKTSKAYSLTTKEELSELSSPHWMSLGTMCNGKCLTVRTSASPRIGKECTLSDNEKILDKYLFFL